MMERLCVGASSRSESGSLHALAAHQEVWWLKLVMATMWRLLSYGGCRPGSGRLLATLQTSSGDKQYWRGGRWISHYPSRIVPSALCKHSWPCGTASERCFVTVGCKSCCVTGLKTKTTCAAKGFHCFLLTIKCFSFVVMSVILGN